MKDEQVALLIREGEGLAVEFKERYSSRIDQDIVAFANARGGSILLGVCDDGTVKGETLTNDLKAKINDLARNCKPRISVQVAQSGKVSVVEISEGAEKPYSCGDGYFRRLNGTTQKMGHDEIRIMFREHDPVPFEERTAKGFSFDKLSRPKVLAFTKEAGVNIGKTTTADFLRSLKVADDKSVRNAGILFFAKDVHEFLPQTQMTLIAFKGTERVHIYDRRDVRDDLFARLHKVERAGTGIQRMKEAMVEVGLKEPEFETNGFFRALFRRSLDFALKRKKTAHPQVPLKYPSSSRQAQIARFLRDSAVDQRDARLHGLERSHELHAQAPSTAFEKRSYRDDRPCRSEKSKTTLCNDIQGITDSD